MKALLFTILVCIFLSLQAQEVDIMGVETKLQFTYDDSGNQIERKFQLLVIGKQSDENLLLSNLYEEMIKVYPNPTRGRFYVEWEKEVSSYLSIVEVLSASAIIQANTIESNQKMLSIDLTSKQSGIYFVRFTFTDGSIITKKVIKL